MAPRSYTEVDSFVVNRNLSLNLSVIVKQFGQLFKGNTIYPPKVVSLLPTKLESEKRVVIKLKIFGVLLKVLHSFAVYSMQPLIPCVYLCIRLYSTYSLIKFRARSLMEN